MTVREACEMCFILRNANPSSKAKIVSYGILKKYVKGELIFREREEIGRIYFVVEGYTALYRTNRNHDRKVIFIYGGGELLNEVILEDSIASISCEALSKVTVLSFSRKQILEIMRGDFEFTRMIMESLAKKVRRLYHQLGNTSNMMHLEKLVAAKLWKLGRDFGVYNADYVQIEFDMSITFFADMVGSKRETVSRILKKLSQKNIINIEKNTFKIYDMEALKRIVLSDNR